MRAMIRRFLLALIVAASAFAHAQETAFTNRATELKDQAASEARTVASLREGTEVKVTQRANGFARVEAAGQSGWIRVFHLRFPAVGQTSSASGVSGGLSSLTSAFSGRSSSQSPTIATTGIRGLSPEDLKNANPDAEALKRMQSYRADRPAAERFAREGKLIEASIDYDTGGRR
jgi:hypothetical protein